MFGVQQHLSLRVFENGPDAAAHGFDYNEWSPKPEPIEIAQAVVIKKGTVNGASTVDLVLTDKDGKTYVVMLTGNLLKTIPC